MKLMAQSYRLLLLVFCLLGVVQVQAQRKNTSYVKYIDQYSSIAVKHQSKHGIPASITLAQGILESGAGQSELARKSNNHFGIKCHNNWTGGRAYHDDDYVGECFRKYRKVEDSYDDHALFLTGRPRYANLFSLDVKDYKGWARGLQKSGYATDKAYANKLIKMIEDYELYKYDSSKGRKSVSSSPSSSPSKAITKRTIYKTHSLIYVYARVNDSFEDVARDLGFKPKDLQKYNEVPVGFPLQEGDLIYLQKKKGKADKPYYDHVVQIGESMHSISQKYGIRIKNLYKMNKKNDEYIPEEGDVLRLR